MLERLQNQRYLLEGHLRNTRFSSLNDQNFVQCGVFWSSWLEHELKRLTEEPLPRELPALEAEEAAFNEIDRQLERVAVETATNG